MAKEVKGKPKKVNPSEKQRGFWGFRPETQRVRVAKDVILQLDLKNIEASTGSYLTDTGFDDHPTVKRREKFDVAFNRVAMDEKYKKENGSLCACCAIGACFISTARLGDRITVDKIMKSHVDNMKKFMKEVFPEQMLLEMEAAFEGDNITDNPKIRDNMNIYNNFYDKYADDETRLRAIMQHIIDHKGKFVTEKLLES